jgi:parallel beta-helix repeat protein
MFTISSQGKIGEKTLLVSGNHKSNLKILNSNSIDKWSLWTGGTKLRGANIFQRRIYPDLDGPTFFGSGSAGPPYTQDDFNKLASWGANYVNISHPGLFTENAPYVLDIDIQHNLDSLLMMIARANMFAVISCRTGPGRSEFTFYWGEDDDWFDASYYNDQVWKEQAAQDGWVDMWRYTADRYKNNPVVIGYDLMVEPNSNEIWLNLWEPDEFYRAYGNTLYDWNQLFPRITASIREKDPYTPILIGGMAYSNVEWLPYVIPTGDLRTIYTVHQYEPFVYTHQEPPLKKSYPGFFDTDWDGIKDQFNRTWIENLLLTVESFKNTHQVPVAVNEFGIMRWEPGSADFMDDQIEIFEQRNINYALWLWETSWKEYIKEVNAFNFRFGPDPNNNKDVLTSALIDVITGHWSKNTIRPSSFQTMYYVDNNHSNTSDSNPGTSNLPWKTIQHAVESVEPGDTIMVMAGIYKGARIENSGGSNSPVCLFATEGAGVVLDSPGLDNEHNSILEVETWEGNSIVTNWIIQGFEIKDSPGYGIDIRNTDSIIVNKNFIHNNSSTGIFTAFSDDVLIKNNESSYNGEHGIYHSNSGDRPTIRNNVLHHNSGCGIHMNGDHSMGDDGIISDGLVETNIIYENSTGGGSGINMDGVTGTIIRNNLLFENHASGISLYKIDGAVCSNNNRVLHNTIVMANDGRWALNIPDRDCTGNKIFNNILYTYHAWRGSIHIAALIPISFESDYNVVVDRFSMEEGTGVLDLAAWQLLGNDTHSFIASHDQLFENPSVNDFHLKAGSPAVDAGSLLVDVAFDMERRSRFLSLAPDIGAYEKKNTAVTYYVSTEGDDTNNGLTPLTSWRTLQYAADSVSPGDTVIVLPGTYKGATFNISGTADSLITFRGESKESVIIHEGLEFARNVAYMDISGFTVQDYSDWGIFVRGSNRHIHMNRLTVTGGEAGIHLTWGYQAQDPLDGPVSDIVIENSLIKDCIYTAVDCTPGPCNNMLFRNLEISGAGITGQDSWGSDGIAVERGDSIIVEDCYIHDNGGDGIDLNSRDFDGYSAGIIVKRNRLVRNHMTGVKAWGGGRIENNIFWGQGFTPLFIGAFPGTYEVINNTIAYNMWSQDFGTRNYAFTAAYPNDDTGISAQIDLTLVNNIFAFNSNDAMGGPTGIYLGEGVTLSQEGHNLFWSRNDGEIQAEFVAGETWFSREQIADGTWALATGQGKENVTQNPLFTAGWPDTDLHLQPVSPAINNGLSIDSLITDIEGNPRPSGGSFDIGAYEYQMSNIVFEFPHAGWYMISLSIVPPDCSVSVIFPSALGQTAYSWNPDEENYHAAAKIEPGEGYWIAFPEPATATVPGIPLQTYTKYFSSQGWYMMGSVVDTVDFTDPDDQPDGSILTPAFGYDSDHKGYVPVDSLIPNEGYWIAVFEACSLSVGNGLLSKTKQTVQRAQEVFFKKFGYEPPSIPIINWQTGEMVNIPDEFVLSQNYPNPFNPFTSIAFDLPLQSYVTMIVYNMAGQKVRTLLSKEFPAGSHEILWDSRDDENAPLCSGLYLYKLEAGAFSAVRKMLLIR